LVFASNKPGDRLSSQYSSQTGSSKMRGYYQTTSAYTGDLADDACEDGYHFASLWEILDPSNLKYNTDLGRTKADSGKGPPSGSSGWARTGSGDTGISTPGYANCGIWDSKDPSENGSGVWLPTDWDAGAELESWMVFAGACNIPRRVWCVEDYLRDQFFKLNIAKSGTGSGKVTSSPAGINCGSDCSEKYIYDTTVTLTSAADSGSTFTGWSGDCSNTGDCIVSMVSDKNVTATFEATNEVSLPVIMR
jgi:hypothetical protein